jgi:hypothetical protein
VRKTLDVKNGWQKGFTDERRAVTGHTRQRTRCDRLPAPRGTLRPCFPFLQFSLFPVHILLSQEMSAREYKLVCTCESGYNVFSQSSVCVKPWLNVAISVDRDVL